MKKQYEQPAMQVTEMEEHSILETSPSSVIHPERRTSPPAPAVLTTTGTTKTTKTKIGRGTPRGKALDIVGKVNTPYGDLPDDENKPSTPRGKVPDDEKKPSTPHGNLPDDV